MAELAQTDEEIIDEIRVDDVPSYGHDFRVERWEEQGVAYLKCNECGQCYLHEEDYRDKGQMCPFR